jgi:putative SOS response-associated peptidase YedK
MCGRYVSTTPTDVLAAQFGVEEIVGDDLDQPRWNVAPTDPVLAVAESKEGVRRLGRMKWGLLPSFATDPSTAARRINARAETVATSPAFRAAFARRRCIVPADGFYEWDKGKQPWFIRRADGRPLAMAGVWELWRAPDGADAGTGPLIRTCAVITTAANQLVFAVHDRMPAILDADSYDAWLDPAFDDAETLRGLLRPAAEDLLIRHPVTSRVNNVRHDGPDLIEPGSIDRPVPLTLL